MKFRHLFCIFFFTFCLAYLTRGQSVSGSITDAYSGVPVPGCGITLRNDRAQYHALSDENGKYQLLEIIPGRYRLIISHEGYNELIASGILVIPGKPLTFRHELKPLAYEMETVYVRASDTWDVRQDPAVDVIGIEQTERYAANFQDPARVVSALPGVAQLNDQANHLSIRGMSPFYARWYLEGMEIVNPNHTNNAGTLSDIPTQAGGGVLLFPSQVLGNTFLSKGPHPVEYSNALSGIVDLHYRNPSAAEAKYTATLSLIGLEANAEGPLGKEKKSSWLANYRYSTVGLLSALGVPLGDEDIRFQDAHVQVNLATGKRSSLKIFGFRGNDRNDFEGKENPDEREEDKERYNIRFENTISGAGMKYQSLVGSKSLFRAGAVYSASDAIRSQLLLIRDGDPSPSRLTEQENRVLSSFLEIQSKSGLTGRFNAGVQFKWLDDRLKDISGTAGVFRSAKGGGSRLQARPYVSWLFQPSGKLQLEAGLAASYWDHAAQFIPEPQLSLTYRVRQNAYFSFRWQRLSQDAGQPVTEVNQAPVQTETPEVATGLLFNFGYTEQISPSRRLSLQAFYTRVAHAAIYGSHIYASQTFDAFPLAGISYTGKERVYGIEFSYDQAISETFFWAANATLYKSQLKTLKSGWHSARFDGGYIFNLNLGKEFEKVTERHARTWGISARVTILGGLRDREINAGESALNETTVYASALYDVKLSTYIRPDLSVYLFKNKGNRTVRWSLDIQNAASIRNAAYFYYDAVTGQVEEKMQLGIIPVLSWRIGF